ncbi:Rho GTPase, putative [Entamoeba invadens IP1]|uniref:small monomeric GTPase n=1 Tax=Entamoeba invadens IP1 TaxID=370355 RepID=A0A0A1UAR9_ENTIV|nr:Rho GTPase, putative [Entamoeba invadens IP1]ELP89243.1 Rho GTPase, putative [Entamoeba invadens IP1]|eukprot:XP_004256014.1 Rho GTPase, putative [Entamoeba invadens IP1]
MATSDSVKLVVIGDGAVGKTCMLMSYTSNDFPSDYVPTVFDNYVANVSVQKKVVSLGLWDTAGQEEFDSLRPLSYPGTDIFLLCYAVNSSASLANLKDKWYPEIQKYCKDEFKMMVGLKVDLRENAQEVKKIEVEGNKMITPEEGQSMCTELDCAKYMECSALTRKGLVEVFETAVEMVLNKNIEDKATKAKTPKKKCVIL